MQAKAGRLTMDSNDSSNGTLTLTGVASHTIWFADRPGRTAGQVPTEDFAGPTFTDKAGNWLSKPNAALYASNPGPNPANDTILIVTLTSPLYDSAADSLTYKVRFIFKQWAATNTVVLHWVFRQLLVVESCLSSVVLVKTKQLYQ